MDEGGGANERSDHHATWATKMEPDMPWEPNSLRDIPWVRKI